MSFEVVIKGLGPMIQALESWPDIVKPELERSAQAALLSLIPALSSYPSPPAASRYVRTGTLGRRWTTAQPEFTQLATGFEATIGNATPYAPEVQGDRQKRIHAGRWATVDTVLADHQVELGAYFNAASKRIVERLEGAA